MNIQTRIPIQHITAIYQGVELDQDGNRYADAATKHDFLSDCLERGIRSGNLQPITTVNQCRDLIARIDATAAKCGRTALTAEQKAARLTDAAQVQAGHANRLALYQRMERGQDTRTWSGSMAWRVIDPMSDEEVAGALK